MKLAALIAALLAGLFAANATEIIKLFAKDPYVVREIPQEDGTTIYRWEKENGN